MKTWICIQKTFMNFFIEIKSYIVIASLLCLGKGMLYDYNFSIGYF
jgi:hypothetical protein